jgi:biopolymer transport protein ExbD
MTTATRSIPNAEPNVTPMIDVLLVLLIVFMMVAVQMHHSIDVQLPEPRTGDSTGEPPIVLEVLPGPTYRLNQRVIAPPNLLAELTATYRGRPDKTIHVAGNAGVRYNDVVNAMDVAKSAGATVIGIVPKAVAPARPATNGGRRQ